MEFFIGVLVICIKSKYRAGDTDFGHTWQYSFISVNYIILT